MTIDEIVSGWSDEYRKQAEPLIRRINELLSKGIPAQQAVTLAIAETGFVGAIAEELKLATGSAAGTGFGVKLSIESAKSIGEKLALLPWAADKLTLSTRLHGIDRALRKNIIRAIDDQIRAGTNWVQMSRKLFDGYGFPETIQRAELPQYLKSLVNAAQAANPNSPETIREVKRLARIAERNIARLAQNEAPNRALKAAYKQLLDVAKKGSAKAIGKAVEVAVNERSRYYAERIARTEISRAWSEGFWAKNYSDTDVVGMRWRLSSRHPKVDICDFHARANLYGMGPGAYPKDANPPHPAHPHCTCRLSPIYVGEVGGPRERVNAGGNEYLRSLDESEQQAMLGVDGVKAWNQGDGWQGYLRSWQGHKAPVMRLNKEDFSNSKAKIEKMKIASDIISGNSIPDKTINGLRVVSETNPLKRSLIKEKNERVGDVVPVKIIKKERDQNNPKNNDLEFYILEDGSAVFVSTNRWARSEVVAFKRTAFRSVDQYLSPLREDVYIRLAPNKQDIEYLKNGNHHGSKNWRDDEWETGYDKETGTYIRGLSVAKRPELVGDLAVYVRGRKIGVGADGEPLIDVKSTQVISKEYSRKAIQVDYDKRLRQKLKAMGLTYEDYLALMKYELRFD